MHLVAVLALDPVVPFDLSIPADTFGWVRLADGSPGYQVRVCAVDGEVGAGPFSIRAPWGLDGLRDADTVVVPGQAGAPAPVPEEALAALRDAAARGARIASICTGAFALAAAGLLDGRRATTHWLGTAELARMHPSVEVDPDVLYVDEGDVLTSAGAAAGMDLCLHMIRLDHGSAVAADSARLAVMPLERDGGQAQFIAHEPPAPDGASVQPLLHWLEDNLHQPLTLADIAARAALSSRTLSRRFREQTGTTPLQWLHRARLRRAQHLLETTGHPVERIAEQVGFTSPTTFRDRFKRLVGTSPARYRRTFRSVA
ncbi:MULTISPECIES: GlxA family transcriptional regulator [unclassified Saccharopolyspora]|uniref:GlxA family transcriptional regulator n=1 Tax=unclassified Saccharopolyspora TaxID=2646250 RepID=UPI001CD3E4B9|nr:MULTISPECIES: helix-turn-helix domain-containing protein [unclassified Saccharopolyspora]MCA1187036.1 helix-turn-helix domain-containing protein [Saccharopolyspora sp. 6T]MCA1191902.1 helix-turn-helix domain-containing protein [Saccharopolyspora sp. 6V]MCA1224825.1 helix-turn-helix domain-containing protein [Saccharopolyspora sp. 6M]MCA1280173.1 helix-turn-helix domain-containing protein [Saccharopolyspora sp. 7B]